MAGYSRENQRQNEALQSILDGKTPEKRILVGYDGDKIELTEKEKEEKNENFLQKRLIYLKKHGCRGFVLSVIK